MRGTGVLLTAALLVSTAAGCGAEPHVSTPHVSAAPDYSLPTVRCSDPFELIIGPGLPVHRREGVESDLDYRLLALDKTLAPESRDVSRGGDYLALDDLVEGLPASRRRALRADLVEEGFQGGLRDIWGSTFCSEKFDVSLWRFATPAGARAQLKTYVDGFEDSNRTRHQARAAVPEALAFLDPQGGLFHHREFDELFTRGPYLAFVTVSSKSDVPAADLQKDGDLLSKAQYQRMTQ